MTAVAHLATVRTASGCLPAVFGDPVLNSHSANSWAVTRSWGVGVLVFDRREFTPEDGDIAVRVVDARWNERDAPGASACFAGYFPQNGSRRRCLSRYD